jgi:hypothetical protein
VSRRRPVILVALAVCGLLAAGVAITVVLRGGGTTPTSALAAPRFIDETASSGIAQTYRGDFPYTVGGGIAVFDCDDDGRPDLYIAGGSGPAALYRNESPVGGALRFSRVADPTTDLSAVTGAYPIDIDGDGNVDLVVLRDGENVVLRGLGGCRFERANEAWGIQGGDLVTMAFSATWEGGQRLPTLAFGNYVANPDNPDPAHLCSDNELVRPRSDGAGYGQPIPLTPAWCSLSMLFTDWDGSGRRDLRISNDRHYYSDLSDGQEQLWRIVPGEPPRLYTDADGWVPVRIEGMGIASYDVTGDGHPDYYLTSQAANKLQTLTSGPAQPTYRDIALKRGVIATRPSTGGDVLPSTAWHPEFEDVNNDGFIDLLVTKGNISEQPDFAAKDPTDLFLGQPDGTFQEANDASGIVEFDRGRGAAMVDLNGDGLLDLVEVKLDAPVRVWRNVGAGDAAAPAQMGHWLAVTPRQTGPNRDAIGSRIEAQVGDATLRREVTVGGGHISGQLGPIHLGLGPATSARVRVIWPDGAIGPWTEIAADRSVILDRDVPGKPTTVTPAP